MKPGIKLDDAAFSRIAEIPWLQQVGQQPTTGFELPTKWLANRTAALQSVTSVEWANTNTHAGGELTGYLARRDYEMYGTSWNLFLKESQAILAEQVGRRITHALEAESWPAALAKTSLPELTCEVQSSIGQQMAESIRTGDWLGYLQAWIIGHASLAVLEMSYRARFRGAPVFFERLLEIYEAGHLPCGWDGNLDEWPRGVLVVH